MISLADDFHEQYCHDPESCYAPAAGSILDDLLAHRYIDLGFLEILEMMEIRDHLRKFVANQEKAMSDDREAARLYKLAADQGDAAAQFNLGVYYAQGRGGLPQDDREAARLFKLAVDHGHANAAAQYNLAVFYEHGRGGLAKNDRKAASLYRLAADQGNASAQCNLGVFYTDGRGGLPRDDRMAARLYKLAADQGNAAARYNLGRFYAQGRGGLPRDDRMAARLYKLAADQGFAEARAALRSSSGMFSRLFGRGVNTRDGWRQQQEEQERRTEAGERKRQGRGEEQDGRRDLASGNMSAAQALEILGISAGATEQDIRTAYNRLMRRVHPDMGGSAYFSKQLNAARDVLLRQLRA
jgi:TPR repeat protein